MELLEELFIAYFDCRKNKRNSYSALEFEVNYEYRIIQLYEKIISRTYDPLPSIAFIVNKPVKREVFAAHFQDRIVHHWLINKLNPIFESLFIEDSYACRVGKGTHYGIQKINQYIQLCTNHYTQDAYILKLDIQGFFMSIYRPLLFEKVKDIVDRYYTFNDKDLVLYISKKIIFHSPTENCIIKGSKTDWNDLPKNKSLFFSPSNCGLPIGNLTSQVFANVYLNDFDHFIKNELKIKYYGRYVDDFVLIFPDKNYLIDCVSAIEDYLQTKLYLTLHPKKRYLQHYTKGVAFLGTFIKPNRIYIGKRIKHNAISKISKLFHPSKLAKAIMNVDYQKRITSVVNSYLGMMVHYNTFNLRKKMCKKLIPPQFKDYISTDKNFSKVAIEKITLVVVFFMLVFSSSSQTLTGKIDHFPNKPFTLSVHIGDSLIPVQKITTNEKGEFQFDLQNLNNVYTTLGKKYGLTKHAMLRIELNRERNQFADVIVQSFYEPSININREIKTRGDKRDIRIHLVYNPSQWFNFAADSAEVKTSEVNKSLYQFQKQWRKVQIAEGWLLEMSRLFPYADEFSKTLINEYYKRYKKMDGIMKEHLKHPKNPESKIALAYYRPVVPDYGMPDGDRFKIFRQHFWEYFDPNDSLFLFTPVLIDKFEEWVYLHHHHKDSIAGLYLDRSDIIQGINSFLEKIDRNQQNKEAVLEYVLKKLDKDEDKRLFIEVYDRWLKPSLGECSLEDTKWEKYHQKASVYRNVVIGAKAPDFPIVAGKVNMYDLKSDYVLLVFWASWCPHCVQEIPRLKMVLEQLKDKKIAVVFISLDEEESAWKSFIYQQKLDNYIHLCDFKKWKGEVVKMYNVYATPTMYLLDKEKKILAKPLFAEQLIRMVE